MRSEPLKQGVGQIQFCGTKLVTVAFHLVLINRSGITLRNNHQ
jgi:hypothetical protein